MAATVPHAAHAPPPQRPAIYEVALPSADDLAVWWAMRDQMKAQESGTRHFPPALDDKKESENISGVACQPTATPYRSCLLIGDEKRYARTFALRGTTVVPGEKVTLTYLDSSGKPQSVQVTLGKAQQ